MSSNPIIAPIAGVESQNFALARVDTAEIGSARVKRVILPVGGRWSKDAKPIVGTEYCQHAHVGFLAQGTFGGEYADGTSFEFEAPAFLDVDPGHDSWVVGDTEVVLIQFDFVEQTLERLGKTSRTTG
jgi:hypothetical protein